MTSMECLKEFCLFSLGEKEDYERHENSLSRRQLLSKCRRGQNQNKSVNFAVKKNKRGDGKLSKLQKQAITA